MRERDVVPAREFEADEHGEGPVLPDGVGLAPNGTHSAGARVQGAGGEVSLGFLGYFGLWMLAAACLGVGWLIAVQVSGPSPAEAQSSGADSEVASALVGLALVALAIPTLLAGAIVAALARSLHPRGWVFFVVSLGSQLGLVLLLAVTTGWRG